MSLYSQQEVFCRNCGLRFLTTFGVFRGEVCTRRCWHILEFKKTLSILNMPYEDPSPEYWRGKGDDLDKLL